jgi:PAS domain S-box-containing protein
MKFSIEQKIRVPFFVSLVCLLGIGAVGYWNASRSISAYHTVDRTHAVLDELEGTWIGILNAETAARAYVSTGNPALLQTCQSGIAALRTGLGHLRRLTANAAGQRQNIAALGPLLEKKMDWLEAAIRERQGLVPPGTYPLPLPREADEVMDEIRHLFATMQTDGRRRLEQDSANAQAEARTTIGLLVLGSFVSIVLVGIASVSVQRDFQRRQQAEAERDRFFSLSRDLMCIATFDGYFKTLNPIWEQALGFSPAELKAKPFVDFVHPDDRAATLAASAKLTSGGDVGFFENRYVCKDGSYRWLSWSARSALPERLIYATARDVTERKQVQMQIAQLNDALQHRAAELVFANKELESFSYSVSHDLRAPLRHMSGFVDLLKRRAAPVLDERSRQHLDFIAGAAQQMGRLVDDLLNFSRMARVHMQQQRVSLSQLVAEVRAELRRDTQGRHVQWKIQPLPDVYGDGPMLRVVLVNLLGNALKYTRTRSPAIIDVGAQANETEHTIFIRDNGVGFDMKYAGKLFGVFQRLHFDDEYEGTGIGLASVQRIVLRHGGRVWAEGKEGEGATFYFTLPLVAPNAANAAPQNRS